MSSGNSTTRRFTKRNESFTCEHCARDVPPAKSTCRNHCPFCLHSKHVDLLPGDRQNPCKGLLVPVGYETDKKKGVVIRFTCQRCNANTRNKALLEDPLQADDYDYLITLGT